MKKILYHVDDFGRTNKINSSIYETIKRVIQIVFK